MAVEVISIGSPNETLMMPGEIFKAVLRHDGTRAILAHNHPSGDSTPSQDDVALTRLMVRLGAEMHLPILDHMVVCANKYTSLRMIQSGIWVDSAD